MNVILSQQKASLFKKLAHAGNKRLGLRKYGSDQMNKQKNATEEMI